MNLRGDVEMEPNKIQQRVNQAISREAMARYMIRQDDPWEASAGEDVRGWPIQDRNGRILGVVEDVFIDATAGRVESVVTASGREIPADGFRVHEHVIVTNEPVSTAAPRAARPGQHARRTRRHVEPGPDSFDGRYHAHFEETFGRRDGQVFSDFLPAYQFGRMQALQPLFYGRPFGRAEEDLQALFELHYPDWTYESTREAIRFGYELGARVRPEFDIRMLEDGTVGPPPAELDRHQISPATEEPGMGEVRDTSSAMTIPGTQSHTAPDRGEDTRPENERTHQP